MASTKPLITFLIDDELLKRLDDFRYGYRLSSRGAAIRFLLEAALDQDPVPEPIVHERADPEAIDTVRDPRRRRGPVLTRATERRRD